MNSSIFIIKGVSGSGKSTRVSFFINLLKEHGFLIESLLYTNTEGKEKNIGFLFKELSLIIIGKFYEKNGEITFQGFDSVTSSFCGVDNFSLFLKANSKKYSFIIEGAGITDSYRFRPLYLAEIGFKNIFVQYYHYPNENKELYLKRIFDRSGKHPEKDAGWNKRNNFKSDFKMSLKEQELLKELNEITCIVEDNEYDESVEDISNKFLNFYL